MAITISGGLVFIDFSHSQFVSLLEITQSGNVMRVYRDHTGEEIADTLTIGEAVALITSRKGGIYFLSDGTKYCAKLTSNRPA